MIRASQEGPPVLSVEGVSVEWGGFRVLNNVSFSASAAKRPQTLKSTGT